METIDATGWWNFSIEPAKEEDDDKWETIGISPVVRLTEDFEDDNVMGWYVRKDEEFRYKQRHQPVPEPVNPTPKIETTRFKLFSPTQEQNSQQLVKTTFSDTLKQYFFHLFSYMQRLVGYGTQTGRNG